MTTDDRHQPQRVIATISFGNPAIITIYYNAAAPTPKTEERKNFVLRAMVIQLNKTLEHGAQLLDLAIEPDSKDKILICGA